MGRKQATFDEICEYCEKRLAIKTTGDGKYWCGRCGLGGSDEPHKNKPVPRRNDPCPCGSGKKYKNCGPHLETKDEINGKRPTDGTASDRNLDASSPTGV